MRKTLFTINMMVLILTTTINAVAQQAYLLPKDIAKSKNQIIVCVKPQIELISIIQTIGKYPSVLGFLMSQDSSEYKSDVLNYFSLYQDHPAVKMFDRLSSQPKMLNFSAPSNIMLYTNSNLCLREDIELDSFVINRIEGKDSLMVFLGLLRDFAIQSSFNEFYNEHQKYYSEIVEKTIKNLGNGDYVFELEEFYGKKQKSYNIVLVSLYSGVGFGNSIQYPNKQAEIYNIMGSIKVDENIPFFGNEDYLKYMIRHEFSHPFINPLTTKYWDYIKGYSDNCDSITAAARKRMCGDCEECINEFVIRAITTHLAFNESAQTGTWAYEKEKSSGVSNLDDLLKKIEKYQSNRENYPTFDSFYCEILDAFKGK
jgi:hypothetical protein